MLDVKEVWEEALLYIEAKLSKPSFDTWFSHTQADMEGDMLVVWSGTVFIQEWLHIRYSKLIIEALEQVTGDSNIKVGFRTPADPKIVVASKSQGRGNPQNNAKTRILH